MTSRLHNTRCARVVAREVKTAGGSDYEAALAVHQHCAVSLLRAHRIARGYTLVEAVDLLKEVLAARGTPSEGLGHQRLSEWEHLHDVPSPHYLDALCLLYRTRPDRLGFGNDYSAPDSFVQNGVQNAMERRQFVNFATAGAMFMVAPPPLFSDSFDPPGGRRATTAYVELLEELTEQNGYQRYMSPAEFIPARMVDLARVQACLLTTTTADIRRRLRRIYAKNAGFIAIRLYDIADAGDTLRWFDVARHAARQAEDEAVQAWIAARTCEACTCYGQFKPGLAAARAAQSAGARRPSSAAVLGYLTEAGVQARLGLHRETLDAVHNADRMFSRLPEREAVDDGFHVGEYVLRWHQAHALSLVGAHAEASPLRARVLELPLAADDNVGTTLIRLDEAIAHINAGELEKGCHTMTDAWQKLSADLRVGVVPERVNEILRTLDTRHSRTRQIAEVRQLLESSTTGRRENPLLARN